MEASPNQVSAAAKSARALLQNQAQQLGTTRFSIAISRVIDRSVQSLRWIRSSHSTDLIHHEAAQAINDLPPCSASGLKDKDYPMHLVLGAIAFAGVAAEFATQHRFFAMLSDAVWSAPCFRDAITEDAARVSAEAIARCLKRGSPQAFAKLANGITRALNFPERRFLTIMVIEKVAKFQPKLLRSGMIMDTFLGEAAWKLVVYSDSQSLVVQSFAAVVEADLLRQQQQLLSEGGGKNNSFGNSNNNNNEGGNNNNNNITSNPSGPIRTMMHSSASMTNVDLLAANSHNNNNNNNDAPTPTNSGNQKTINNNQNSGKPSTELAPASLFASDTVRNFSMFMGKSVPTEDGGAANNNSTRASGAAVGAPGVQNNSLTNHFGFSQSIVENVKSKLTARLNSPKDLEVQQGLLLFEPSIEIAPPQSMNDWWSALVRASGANFTRNASLLAMVSLGRKFPQEFVHSISNNNNNISTNGKASAVVDSTPPNTTKMNFFLSRLKNLLRERTENSTSTLIRCYRLLVEAVTPDNLMTTEQLEEKLMKDVVTRFSSSDETSSNTSFAAPDAASPSHNNSNNSNSNSNSNNSAPSSGSSSALSPSRSFFFSSSPNQNPLPNYERFSSVSTSQLLSFFAFVCEFYPTISIINLTQCVCNVLARCTFATDMKNTLPVIVKHIASHSTAAEKQIVNALFNRTRSILRSQNRVDDNEVMEVLRVCASFDIVRYPQVSDLIRCDVLPFFSDKRSTLLRLQLVTTLARMIQTIENPELSLFHDVGLHHAAPRSSTVSPAGSQLTAQRGNFGGATAGNVAANAAANSMSEEKRAAFAAEEQEDALASTQSQASAALMKTEVSRAYLFDPNAHLTHDDSVSSTTSSRLRTLSFSSQVNEIQRRKTRETGEMVVSELFRRANFDPEEAVRLACLQNLNQSLKELITTTHARLLASAARDTSLFVRLSAIELLGGIFKKFPSELGAAHRALLVSLLESLNAIRLEAGPAALLLMETHEVMLAEPRRIVEFSSNVEQALMNVRGRAFPKMDVALVRDDSTDPIFEYLQCLCSYIRIARTACSREFCADALRNCALRVCLISDPMIFPKRIQMAIKLAANIMQYTKESSRMLIRTTSSAIANTLSGAQAKRTQRQQMAAMMANARLSAASHGVASSQTSGPSSSNIPLTGYSNAIKVLTSDALPHHSPMSATTTVLAEANLQANAIMRQKLDIPIIPSQLATSPNHVAGGQPGADGGSGPLRGGGRKSSNEQQFDYDLAQLTYICYQLLSNRTFDSEARRSALRFSAVLGPMDPGDFEEMNRFLSEAAIQVMKEEPYAVVANPSRPLPWFRRAGALSVGLLQDDSLCEPPVTDAGVVLHALATRLPACLGSANETNELRFLLRSLVGIVNSLRVGRPGARELLRVVPALFQVVHYLSPESDLFYIAFFQLISCLEMTTSLFQEKKERQKAFNKKIRAKLLAAEGKPPAENTENEADEEKQFLCRPIAPSEAPKYLRVGSLYRFAPYWTLFNIVEKAFSSDDSGNRLYAVRAVTVMFQDMGDGDTPGARREISKSVPSIIQRLFANNSWQGSTPTSVEDAVYIAQLSLLISMEEYIAPFASAITPFLIGRLSIPHLSASVCTATLGALWALGDTLSIADFAGSVVSTVGKLLAVTADLALADADWETARVRAVGVLHFMLHRMGSDFTRFSSIKPPDDVKGARAFAQSLDLVSRGGSPQNEASMPEKQIQGLKNWLEQRTLNDLETFIAWGRASDASSRSVHMYADRYDNLTPSEEDAIRDQLKNQTRAMPEFLQSFTRALLKMSPVYVYRAVLPDEALQAEVSEPLLRIVFADAFRVVWTRASDRVQNEVSEAFGMMLENSTGGDSASTILALLEHFERLGLFMKILPSRIGRISRALNATARATFWHELAYKISSSNRENEKASVISELRNIIRLYRQSGATEAAEALSRKAITMKTEFEKEKLLLEEQVLIKKNRKSNNNNNNNNNATAKSIDNGSMGNPNRSDSFNNKNNTTSLSKSENKDVEELQRIVSTLNQTMRPQDIFFDLEKYPEARALLEKEIAEMESSLNNFDDDDEVDDGLSEPPPPKPVVDKKLLRNDLTMLTTCCVKMGDFKAAMECGFKALTMYEDERKQQQQQQQQKLHQVPSFENYSSLPSSPSVVITNSGNSNSKQNKTSPTLPLATNSSSSAPATAATTLSESISNSKLQEFLAGNLCQNVATAAAALGNWDAVGNCLASPCTPSHNIYIDAINARRHIGNGKWEPAMNVLKGAFKRCVDDVRWTPDQSYTAATRILENAQYLLECEEIVEALSDHVASFVRSDNHVIRVASSGGNNSAGGSNMMGNSINMMGQSANNANNNTTNAGGTSSNSLTDKNAVVRSEVQARWGNRIMRLSPRRPAQLRLLLDLHEHVLPRQELVDGYLHLADLYRQIGDELSERDVLQRTLETSTLALRSASAMYRHKKYDRSSMKTLLNERKEKLAAAAAAAAGGATTNTSGANTPTAALSPSGSLSVHPLDSAPTSRRASGGSFIHQQQQQDSTTSTNTVHLYRLNNTFPPAVAFRLLRSGLVDVSHQNGQLDRVAETILDYEKHHPEMNDTIAQMYTLLSRQCNVSQPARALDFARKACDLDGYADSVWRCWAELHRKRFAINPTLETLEHALGGLSKCIQLAESPTTMHCDILSVMALWRISCSEAKGELSQDNVRLIIQRHLPSLPTHAWRAVIPQLVALMSVQEDADLVHEILEHVFDEFPNDIVFPLLMSREASDDIGGLRRSQLSSELLRKGAMKHAQLIADAELVAGELHRLASPLWKDTIQSAIEICETIRDAGKKDVNTERVAYELGVLHDRLRRPSSIAEALLCQKHAKDIVAAETAVQNFLNIAPHWIYLQDAHTVYQRIGEFLESKDHKFQPLELQNVSPNLFGARNLQLAVPSVQQLSIPGEVVPTPVRIASFGTKIIVMKSKQAPRVVVMQGSDGVTYRFLVKGGEDLRLDERVMHLFGLINALLREGRSAKGASHMHRQLFIERYNVTPLSPNTGLIGWVNNVSTMHDVVGTYREGVGVPNAPGLEFLLRTHLAPDLPGFNVDVVGKLSIMQQTELFDYVCENTTGMDLQRAFWVWSSSTEQWFDHRTLFSQSAAVTSIAGYLLGLGDRHVENLMINKATGKVVHIDFGECFEENMKRPSFPERVPFRLTRMMRNAMDQADHRGHFRSAAIHTLGVARENGVALSLMMEAFLHDPLVNWNKSSSNKLTSNGSDIKGAILVTSATLLDAHTHQGKTFEMAGTKQNFSVFGKEDDFGSQNLNSNTTGIFEDSSGANLLSGEHSGAGADAGEGSFSEDAVRIVRRVKAKLEGRDFNPSSPDERHPLNNHKHHQQRVPLSTTQQVESIIDAAVDPMHLGTMWVGWFPWW